MKLQQTNVTGCRIIGAIEKTLGHLGPKHHGVILGQSPINQEIYIAENMSLGYQVCTYTDFNNRYSANGGIIIEPNDGEAENISVANRTIEELKRGGEGAYNLITNNCECFVNRAMHGKSISKKVTNTVIGIAVIVGLVYVIKNKNSSNKLIQQTAKSVAPFAKKCKRRDTLTSG